MATPVDDVLSWLSLLESLASPIQLAIQTSVLLQLSLKRTENREIDDSSDRQLCFLTVVREFRCIIFGT